MWAPVGPRLGKVGPQIGRGWARLGPIWECCLGKGVGTGGNVYNVCMMPAINDNSYQHLICQTSKRFSYTHHRFHGTKCNSECANLLEYAILLFTHHYVWVQKGKLQNGIPG